MRYFIYVRFSKLYNYFRMMQNTYLRKTINFSMTIIKPFSFFLTLVIFHCVHHGTRKNKENQAILLSLALASPPNRLLANIVVASTYHTQR